MTVHSYLNFVSEIKQIPASERKEAVEKAIGISGLETVRRRLIKNISRGFKQRVGIAQALIHDPQILILDEPTIGLDPAQIKEIRELIKSLKGERTILLSTQELTASFKEKEGIMIKLKKGGKNVLSLLQKIHGVDKVSSVNDEFKIEWTKGKDVRDEITKLVVEKELGLIEMRPLAMNIEDLYLKVVSGGVDQ
jgi:ABC-2 type transport system ATP-binding protein